MKKVFVIVRPLKWEDKSLGNIFVEVAATREEAVRVVSRLNVCFPEFKYEILEREIK